MHYELPGKMFEQLHISKEAGSIEPASLLMSEKIIDIIYYTLIKIFFLYI